MGLSLPAAAALVGTAASLAGTGVSIAAQQEQKSRMEKAVRAQLSQQNQYQKKASATYQQNAQASSPKAVQQQIASGTSAAKQLYNQLQSIPLTSVGAGNGEDQIVRDSMAASHAAPLAGMQAFDVNQLIRNMTTQARLGVGANQSQIAASVLPYQLAGSANSELAGLGSLLSSAGNVAGIYGSTHGAFSPQNGSAPLGLTYEQWIAQQRQGRSFPQFSALGN